MTAVGVGSGGQGWGGRTQGHGQQCGDRGGWVRGMNGNEK